MYEFETEILSQLRCKFNQLWLQTRGPLVLKCSPELPRTDIKVERTGCDDYSIHFLPNKILDWPEFKASAEDKVNVT